MMQRQHCACGTYCPMRRHAIGAWMSQFFCRLLTGRYIEQEAAYLRVYRAHDWRKHAVDVLFCHGYFRSMCELFGVFVVGVRGGCHAALCTAESQHRKRLCS